MCIARNKFNMYMQEFAREEDGGEMIEYTLIVLLVAVLAGALFVVGNIIYQQIVEAGNAISGLDIGTTTGGAGNTIIDSGIGNGIGG